MFKALCFVLQRKKVKPSAGKMVLQNREKSNDGTKTRSPNIAISTEFHFLTLLTSRI